MDYWLTYSKALDAGLNHETAFAVADGSISLEAALGDMDMDLESTNFTKRDGNIDPFAYIPF